MDKKILNRRILVTGGGSGGHLSAASSIISELQNKYILDSNTFMYVGGDLGMVGEETGNSIEQKIFKNAPFECKYIRAGKLQREFSFTTIKLLFRTILGFFDSYRILKSFRPEIIISTGGFVTVPVCLVGKIFKAKIFLHEQTATVGLANKIVGKISEKIFITYDSSAKYFGKKKTIRTGNLVREEIFNTKGTGSLSKDIKEMVAKQEQLPIIYISGGGLGSHIINETVKEALNKLITKYQIVLQTGENKTFKDYEVLNNLKQSLQKDLRNNFLPVTYIGSNDIGYLLNNIDLFVGRSGANTVYEMGILRIPSLLIPIPWVTNNEQQKNAEILVNLGLAEILPEGELTPSSLVSRIDSFLHKSKTIDNNKISEVFRTDASTLILEQIGI